jgi:positive regulator of sigma E activity
VIKLAKILQINSADIVLKIEKESQCTDCKSRCSDGFLHFLFNKKNKEGTIVVDRNHHSEKFSHLIDDELFFDGQQNVNDVVGIKFNESQLLKLSLVLYGMPILILVLSLIMGHSIFLMLNLNQDLGAVFGMIFGLVLSKIIIKLNYTRLKPRVRFFK